MSQIELFPADRFLKLRDVERSLADLFHAESRPSSNTIIGWIEEGQLNAIQIGRGRNYYVLESSLLKFKESWRQKAARLAA